jgi:selenocysteine-specific elongation factor
LQAVRTASAGASLVVADAAIAILVARGQMVAEGAHVSRAGWSANLSDSNRALSDRALNLLATAGSEPPSVADLEASLGTDVVPILRFLERAGRVVLVEDGRYYAKEAVDVMVERVRRGMVAAKEYGPAELRDLLGLSRKYLIPFLEYCDRVGITERRVGGRVRTGT